MRAPSLLALFAALVWLPVSADVVTFAAQPPEHPGVFDAPLVSRVCQKPHDMLEARLVFPSDGINADTGLLINLPGYSPDADCDPQPIELLDWHDTKNLVVATIAYRNLAFRFPTDFGKLGITDVLRGTGAVLEAHPGLNPDRLYLFGGSGGGHLALQVYHVAPDLFDEVHVHSAITRITTREDLQHGYRTRWNGNLQFPETQGNRDDETWRRYQAERELRAPQFHFLHQPRSTSTPLWIFHGTEDPLVSFQHFLDLRGHIVEALGDELTDLSPVVSRIRNKTFVAIEGGDHSYAGAAVGETLRVLATARYVPDAFTTVRDTPRPLAVNYLSAPSHGYKLHVYGADLTSVEVHAIPEPDWAERWACCE